jgi:succinylarginine dihydrolase
MPASKNKSFEVNFDGLVGPTHNYGGLAFGNRASLTHEKSVSNPRAAALQGLQKLKFVADLGLPQAVLPPPERPHFKTLRRLGFRGSDETVLQTVARRAPDLLIACASASSMWAANAATAAPAHDTRDGKLHVTPANLVAKFHRSIEAGENFTLFKTLFAGTGAKIHRPLPANAYFGDEGAANHTRLAKNHSEKAVHLFVYGRRATGAGRTPRRFPARQTREASAAVARLHRLSPDHVILAQQNPEVIDAGVFHNDVISVGNEDFLITHEKAYLDQESVLQEIQNKFLTLSGTPVEIVLVSERQVSVTDAIGSYLFNSQLVTLPNGEMHFICPEECRQIKTVNSFLDSVLEKSSKLKKIHFFDLKQSMQNGGGPACLRLRLVLTADELNNLHDGVRINESRYARLRAWVETHYRDRLTASDLADPKLLRQNRTALDELTQILNLGSYYEFQRS